MRTLLFLFLLALPFINVAQRKSNAPSLNFNKNYVYECNGSFYQFNSNGTGSLCFDYTICIDSDDLDFVTTFEFTWKKKTSNVITVTRDAGGEKVSYDVKILSNSKISVNQTGNQWDTFVLKQKSKLLE